MSTVHAVNNYKGSIYMVSDYMDHDLTGLMERCKYKFEVGQVRSAEISLIHTPVVAALGGAIGVEQRYPAPNPVI